MGYERVQKLFEQSSSKKKHTPIVPPLIEQETLADSQLSPKVKPSRIPSSEERETIKRKIFDSIRRTGENQAMGSGLYSLTAPVQKTPESVGAIGMPIQAKLTIGAPGDKYEQEADRVAFQVVNQINAPVTHQKSQNLQREEMSSLDELQIKSEADNIQRSEMLDEEKLQMQTMVQLQLGGGSMTTTPEVETSIQQARGGGQSLANNIREPMEQAFGADFSRVKVHTDTQSDQLNQSIQAKAFTTGQDVFFRSGEYNPGSRSGQELIAHELTHVVQQSRGALQREQLQKMNQAAEVSEITVTDYEKKQLKDGAIFEHIKFNDGSYWSTKIVSSGPYQGKHVYLDIREGLHQGEGYSVQDQDGYKAQEVKQWLLNLYPDLDKHWKAYREKATA